MKTLAPIAFCLALLLTACGRGDAFAGPVRRAGNFG